MKVYIDLLFIFNCWIDFCLLIMVKLTLRRVNKMFSLIIASFFGGLTTFCIFININYIILFVIKIILSLLLVIIAFGYKDISYTFKNFIYLLMYGIILGGLASYLKINSNNKYLYIISVIIMTPIMCFLYYFQNKKIKKIYNLYYDVKILFDDKFLDLCGFLDSGNSLKDPITNKYIIIVNKNKIKGINKIRSPMYVPIKTVNKSSLIKCYKPDELFINNKKYNNYLIGIMEEKISLDGVDCLLNNRLLEDI